MNSHILTKTTQGSLDGAMGFPEVVETLTREGVESYHVDLVQNLKTFYSSQGEVYAETFSFEGSKIAADFSQEKVIAAIRSSQAQKINYRQFLHAISEAGSTGYTVYLEGKRAIYFGRKGEMHVEEFPRKA